MMKKLAPKAKLKILKNRKKIFKKLIKTLKKIFKVVKISTLLLNKIYGAKFKAIKC